MGRWISLAVHGTDGILWLLKNRFFRPAEGAGGPADGGVDSSFARLAMPWLPCIHLAGFFGWVFLTTMCRKDESLARYPFFAAYQQRSALLLPRLAT